MSSVFYGKPINRDGTPLVDAHGNPQTDAQPPFLLRFSPRLFAKEAPEVFEWDPATNKLKLKDGVKPPWIRNMVDWVKDKGKTWLYCQECKDRYLPTKGQPNTRPFIPYRDKAAQRNLRPHRRMREPVPPEETAATPEEEPVETPLAAHADSMADA